MKRFCLVALLALSLPVAVTRLPPRRHQRPSRPAPSPAAGAARTIEITGGDDMKYNVTEITAKRG